MVDMPKSTLLRLLNTMKAYNWVRQNSSTKRFSLGLGLVALGKAAEKSFDMAGVMHSFLVDLTEKTGETTSLAMLEGDKPVNADHVVSKNMIRGEPRVGLVLALHCSAGGKMLLSAMDDEKIERIIERQGLKQKTAKTITDREVLKNEIHKIRERGYAVADEEFVEGGRSIAAPIKDNEGQVVAAISVMGPSTRIRQEDLGEISTIVKDVASKASAALGFTSLE